jgi:hypothetical protein
MTRTADALHTLRIIAQDPAVRVRGEILMASVPVPAEKLWRGPWGHRVQVIDYDATSGLLYEPLEYATDTQGRLVDPFAKQHPATLIADPRFHQQNVYAIVMRTLAYFERVLGRRISWGFKGHQLKVSPHAFEDANAFYSERDYGLFFGYFTGPKGRVFSCLSHDVVVHETTHALLDGLRERFTDPSSPDQAAFHEGFADVVAVLSVFALPEIIGRLLSLAPGASGSDKRVPRRFLDDEPFVRGLLGVAEELGAAIYGIPGRSLRASYTTKPDRTAYSQNADWLEPHRRGELLVAAMLGAFVRVWQARLQPLGVGGSGGLDRDRVVEEGAAAAEHLLNIAIRGIDYTPPVHLTFGDYLSAILTADHEVQPDDRRYEYRRLLRESFAAWGIEPGARPPDKKRSETAPLEPGLWCPLDPTRLSYDAVHHEAMRRDPDEVFRFLWQNRDALQLRADAFTEVLSVRPCRRFAPDGAWLHETVVEARQKLELSPKEQQKVKGLGALRDADDADDEGFLTLTGGGTFIFDDFGTLKYHIHNAVDNFALQEQRVANILASPLRSVPVSRRFAELHRLRASDRHLLMPADRW